MKKLLPYIIIALFLNAFLLNAQNQRKAMTKMEQVMASHDEVMDEMPRLSKLINKLQSKADTSTDKQKYQAAIANLKAANKSMMRWMTGFGNRFEADEMLKGKKLSELKQKWLLEEEEKIAAVEKEIELGIEQAKQLLKE